MKSFDLIPYLKVPSEIPEGYTPLAEEPTFNPARDLQLTKPTRSWQLSELGYTGTEISDAGCSLAFTEPFQVLSEEGAARLQEVVRLPAPGGRGVHRHDAGGAGASVVPGGSAKTSTGVCGRFARSSSPLSFKRATSELARAKTFSRSRALTRLRISSSHSFSSLPFAKKLTSL